MLNDHKEIEADVNAGSAQLLEWGNGELLTVIRIEGAELVYCCVAGRNLRQWVPHLVNLAQRLDCQTIRFHAGRKAQARLVRRWNPVMVGKDGNGLNMYRIWV